MIIHCDVMPLWAVGEKTKDTIARTLCWPASDFHKKITGGKLCVGDGVIALAVDCDGHPVGWARSEPWTDSDGIVWATLEAFVRHEHRRRGIAAFATAGLAVNVFASEGYGCAVFSPAMLLVAARAGLHPTLFERDGTEWRRTT